ncbi:MAG: AsmA-like C-terminal region-containing protein [Candidatus Obscuribacterales bacterium]|nr:AsmA-like C-terminal region-containing protein [Candidatus Obscuribacterales bacterium]
MAQDIVDVPESSAGLHKQKVDIVVKFLVGWIASVMFLVVLALLTNIEWARPHIEKSLQQSFHRNAKLGRLAWHLGLNGLAIDTNRFILEGRNGENFIRSGHSELGIAFLPLFEKRVIIKHVAFREPEVWVVQEAPNVWNFSDLLTEGPEIHLVQVENGKLHLSNKVKGTWQSYDVDDIDLKFGLPRKQKENWPVYLDCKIPVTRDGQRETTAVKLSIKGNGPYDQWKTRPYSFSLELKNFNPKDLKSLVPKLPNIDGDFTCKFSGSGVLEKGISATISSAISQLRLPTSEPGGIAELPCLDAQGTLLIKEKTVSWKDLEVKLNDWKVASSGQLENRNGKISYRSQLEGELGDLQGLYGRVLSRFFVLSNPAGLERFANAENLGKGKAKVALQLDGEDSVHQLSSTIKAEGIPIKDLLDLGVKEYASFLPELNPESPVSGEIVLAQGRLASTVPAVSVAKSSKNVSAAHSGSVKSEPADLADLFSVEVRNLAVPFENTILRLSGRMNSGSSDGRVAFAISDLDAKGLKKLPKQSLDEQTLRMIRADKLTGKLDVSGNVQLSGAERKIAVQTSFKDVSLKGKGGAILLQGLSGSLAFDGKKLSLANLHGILPVKGATGSDFAASGFLTPGADRKLSLQIEGKNIDVTRVRELAQEVGIASDAAGFDLNRLEGKIQDLKLQVNGCAANPTVSFKISGPQLQLERDEPHGKHIFRLSSGTIEHDKGQTSIKDVVVSSGGGGKLTVSAQMRGSLQRSKIKSLWLQTDGVDLAEWRPVLGPSLLPPDMLSALPPGFRPVRNAPVLGHLFGDLKISESGDGFEADGVFGFQNAGTKVGARGVALEKLTGIIAFTPEEVILQELTGNYGKSNFAVDGKISDYRRKLSWHGQLKGRFFPEELAAIIRATGTGIDLESTERDAVALRLSGVGNPSEYKLFFNGRAESHSGLKLAVGAVEVYQPQELPLSFDGGVNVKVESPFSVEMEKCVISAGEHDLKLQGTMKEVGGVNTADMKLTTMASMPFPLLAAMLYPGKFQHSSGESDLLLSFFGPVDALHVNGSLKLSEVSIPIVGVANLNAKLELPNFALKPKPDDKVIPSKLTISSAQVCGFDVKDGQAELVSDGERISLRDGEAKIAGGKIKASGFYEPDGAKYGADLSIGKLAVAEFIDDYIKRDGKVSGQADLNLSLHGEAGPGWMKELNGKGKFSVQSGTIQSVGKLQGKLHGANLLQQGLLGFNINNFVQAVFPNRTGTFREIDGELSIRSGVIDLAKVRYDGNDLRMRAAGAVNLPAGTVDIDVAGDIPRVATSLIPGAVGEISREMTLQKLLGIVTLKQLEDLPSLPLLGDIASDHPRVFSFAVSAPLDKPEQITKSVEKTFKWLPPKPYASAHPVPGL